MDKQTKRAKKYIEKAKKILILSHKGPDMDAFCSMLSTYLILKEMYPKKDISMKTKQTPNMKLPKMQEIQIVESIEHEGEDLIIIVDASTLTLCIDESKDTIQEAGVPILFIDHHKTDVDVRDVDVYINEVRASAVEQVYVTFKSMFGKKLRIEKEVAELIQYGILTDTGRFMFENAGPETHRIFAEVSEISPVDVEAFEYKNSKFSSDAVPVIAEYLENLQIEEDMAYLYISKDSVLSKNYLKHGISGAHRFVRDSILRYIQGTHWGFVIKPVLDTENLWYVSFRSTEGYQDVEVIALELGGGGHRNSSAAKMEGNTAEEVIQKILSVVHQKISV